MNCGLQRHRLDIGKHDHLTVRTGLQHPVGVCDVVEREPASDVADYGAALRGQGQCIRDETSEFVESFDPTHTVVLGDEEGPRKELVRLMVGAGPDNSP
jgi:hypothetical protein